MEVSAGALRRNARTIRQRVGEGVAFIPMVKADAYGLGMARTVAALEGEEPWGYGVATMEEGLDLRKLGVDRPVLVCSPTPPGSYRAAVEADLIVSLSDLGGAQALTRAAGEVGRRGRFHLEVDTGMGRAGFDWRTAGEWGPKIEALLDGPVRWEGCFTHFHSADVADETSVSEQWARLGAALESLALPSGEFLLHTCNSACALRRPDFAAGGVRPGIYLYGGVAGEGLPPPAPVAALRARVSLVREVPAGTTVGYGATYAASKRETWATVGIGYGDGLPRLLSNRGHALVKGVRVPVVGRISMDVTVVDVTRVPGVAAGDVVTLVGKGGEEEITLEEVAGHARTIDYEILTGLTRRLPRIWRDDDG